MPRQGAGSTIEVVHINNVRDEGVFSTWVYLVRKGFTLLSPERAVRTRVMVYVAEAVISSLHGARTERDNLIMTVRVEGFHDRVLAASPYVCRRVWALIAGWAVVQSVWLPEWVTEAVGCKDSVEVMLKECCELCVRVCFP